MYLSRIYIKNFRSLKELDISLKPGKNVIVGRNNSGKSNIIRAINLVLGENSPTWDRADTIVDNDFFSWKESNGEEEVTKAADEIYIWCELILRPEEALNYDELYKAPGYFIFSRLIEERPRTYRPIRLPKESIPSESDLIFGPNEDENEREYVNPKLRNQSTIERHLKDKSIFGLAFRAKKAENGTIKKEMRFLYRENEDVDWILSFRAPYRNEFLQSALIPSFRDPSGQLRLVNWSWYGKLVRYLTKGHEDKPELLQAFRNVSDVARDIFSEINQSISQSTFQIAFPGTTIDFQFNAENKDDLYKSTIIYIDDGFKSQLFEKGSGIQSATIIGLFNFYVRYVNTVTSALLCIEEPEIYLHPHARRVISDKLDEFLDGAKNQVILTTHSPEFIRTTNDEMNVLLTRKTSSGTTTLNVGISEFSPLLIDSNQNEVFFAEKAIICENLDAHLLRVIASFLIPGELDKNNISIISAGGKDRIDRLAKMIMKMKMPVYILADFDYLLRDADELSKKYKTTHKSVVSLGADYFSLPDVFGPDHGNEIYSELQKTRGQIKSTEEEGFYTAKRADQLTLNTSELLRKLRLHGVCILDSEIEGLCNDSTLMNSDNKLTLEKVFQVNGRLLAGENIRKLFNTSQLEEFLAYVVS